MSKLVSMEPATLFWPWSSSAKQEYGCLTSTTVAGLCHRLIINLLVKSGINIRYYLVSNLKDNNYTQPYQTTDRTDHQQRCEKGTTSLGQLIDLHLSTFWQTQLLRPLT